MALLSLAFPAIAQGTKTVQTNSAQSIWDAKTFRGSAIIQVTPPAASNQVTRLHELTQTNAIIQAQLAAIGSPTGGVTLIQVSNFVAGGTANFAGNGAGVSGVMASNINGTGGGMVLYSTNLAAYPLHIIGDLKGGGPGRYSSRFLPGSGAFIANGYISIDGLDSGFGTSEVLAGRPSVFPVTEDVANGMLMVGPASHHITTFQWLNGFATNALYPTGVLNFDVDNNGTIISQTVDENDSLATPQLLLKQRNSTGGLAKMWGIEGRRNYLRIGTTPDGTNVAGFIVLNTNGTMYVKDVVASNSLALLNPPGSNGVANVVWYANGSLGTNPFTAGTESTNLAEGINYSTNAIFVSMSRGNDATATRGTTLAWKNLTNAAPFVQNGDCIYLIDGIHDMTVQGTLIFTNVSIYGYNGATITNTDKTALGNQLQIYGNCDLKGFNIGNCTTNFNATYIPINLRTMGQTAYMTMADLTIQGPSDLVIVFASTNRVYVNGRNIIGVDWWDGISAITGTADATNSTFVYDNISILNDHNTSPYSSPNQLQRQFRCGFGTWFIRNCTIRALNVTNGVTAHGIIAPSGSTVYSSGNQVLMTTNSGGGGTIWKYNSTAMGGIIINGHPTEDQNTSGVEYLGDIGTNAPFSGALIGYDSNLKRVPTAKGDSLTNSLDGTLPSNTNSLISAKQAAVIAAASGGGGGALNIQTNGASVGAETNANFVGGAGIKITAVNGGESNTITITATTTNLDGAVLQDDTVTSDKLHNPLENVTIGAAQFTQQGATNALAMFNGDGLLTNVVVGSGLYLDTSTRTLTASNSVATGTNIMSQIVTNFILNDGNSYTNLNPYSVLLGGLQQNSGSNPTTKMDIRIGNTLYGALQGLGQPAANAERVAFPLIILAPNEWINESNTSGTGNSDWLVWRLTGIVTSTLDSTNVLGTLTNNTTGSAGSVVLPGGGSYTTNALAQVASVVNGTNLTLNLAQYTNTAELSFRVVATNDLYLNWVTNAIDGKSFVLSIRRGNTGARVLYNTTPTTTSAFWVSAGATNNFVSLPTNSSDSRLIISCFVVGSNIVAVTTPVP